MDTMNEELEYFKREIIALKYKEMEIIDLEGINHLIKILID
jgi:hypothetical protein